MRPPSQFGNDITNNTNNNANNNNNDNDGNEENEFPASIAHMGGTLIFTRQAGRAVIRVVGRCEDAKENGRDLGEFFVSLIGLIFNLRLWITIRMHIRNLS